MERLRPSTPAPDLLPSDLPPSDLPAPSTVPTRHRAAEARGARLGRPLRVLGRVRDLDESLMRDIGEGYLRVDERGAEVAALCAPGRTDRVTHAHLRRALRGELDDLPDVLRDLVEQLAQPPDWLDLALLEEGARFYRRLGRNAGDVLLQLSLIGGYRFGGPTDLLVLTGGLTGPSTMRRLAETQHWTMAVTEPGALRPWADGWRLTVHVRLMHALVNARLRDDPRWDRRHWGEPINQSDQAATLALFSGTLLLGVRALGVPVSREDSRAVMHLWRYVGWLLGVDDAWLFDDERAQHRFGYHVLCSQDGLTEAGRLLTHSIVDAQADLHFRRLARLQRRYAPARLLSMLRPFLGTASMRELDLPVRLPWATVQVVAANTVLYRLVARTARGRRRLDAWAARYRQEQLHRYFGDAPPDVGAL
ncbi:MAG: oxygenase MpaB family protein [Propionibacteriales bacterium]|nr:oxygenase MpaB family protein [Propionibacteriales bacterium]